MGLRVQQGSSTMPADYFASAWNSILLHLDIDGPSQIVNTGQDFTLSLGNVATDRLTIGDGRFGGVGMTVRRFVCDPVRYEPSDRAAILAWLDG